MLGQTIARQVLSDSVEVPALGALGMTRRQQRVMLVGRWVGAGVVAAVLAVLGAAALSAQFPVGPARRAEPDPGLQFDGPVMLAGGAAIVLLTVSAALIGSGWALRRARAPVRGRVPECKAEDR